MKKLLIGSLCASMLLTQAFAEESNSSTATVAPQKKAAGTDKADQLITNRRLRASTGSLSKWSVSTAWSYQAGSLTSPLDPERPNLTAGADVQSLQSLSGSIGVKYRLTKTDSLSLSTGLAMVTPFHTSIDTNNANTKKQFDQNAQKLNVNDPNLGYTKLSKFAGIQSVTAVDATYYTTNFYKNNNILGQFNIAQQFIKDVGTSGFSFGALVQANVFANGSDTVDGKDISGNQPSHGFGFYPMAEYVINDTFNLRTISGVLVFQNTNDQDTWTFSQLTTYQSVGLGISVSRDVFLYPNIQFLPEDIAADKTNIGLSANINIF